MKTIKMIRGKTSCNGVPFWANTSQDTFEADNIHAESLINQGFAIEVKPILLPSVPMVNESVEVLETSISELQAKIAESEQEKKLLISDTPQDIAGLTKKLTPINATIASLTDILKCQETKLIEAKRLAALARDEKAVTDFAETAKEQAKLAKKIMVEIVSALEKVASGRKELAHLYETVNIDFIELGGNHNGHPLLSLIGFGIWSEEAIKEMEVSLSSLSGHLSVGIPKLEAAATLAPKKLQQVLNAKHFKNERELEKERENALLKEAS